LIEAIGEWPATPLETGLAQFARWLNTWDALPMRRAEAFSPNAG